MVGAKITSIEITAGGPGSTKGDCCGVTVKLNTGKDGNGPPQFIIEKEDWFSAAALVPGVENTTPFVGVHHVWEEIYLCLLA